MASIEADIFDALMMRVNDYATTLPIAWPNVNFSPPADGKYLRVDFIPNVTDRVAITSKTPHRYLGIMQVSVFWPRNAGEREPREEAGKVAAWFPVDLAITRGAARVRITKSPAVSNMIVDEQAVQIPVSVEWESFG